MIGYRLENGTVANYYVLCNSRGDVEFLYNGSGDLRVRYLYDAWGNIISITDGNGNAITDPMNIGSVNPIRYRGYYYDGETGLYATGTRYYDPVVGRFINADGYVSTGQGFNGNNMFAYCGNNPVMRADPSGKFWFLAVIAVVVVGALLTGCSDQPSKPAPASYSSPDAAASAFATNTYSSSSYSRHEYGGEIYSKTSGGKTTYHTTEARVGSPHGVVVGKQNIPKGAKLEATIHTHPNSNSFSTADMNNAHTRGVNNYVIGPDLNLQRYNISDKTTDIVGAISPVALTGAQRSNLESSLRVSWDSHMSGGTCPNGFGCENKTWPNP